MNPAPLRVSTKAGPPAVTDGGFDPEIWGVGVVMAIIAAAELTLPGFVTVTLAVPGATMRLAGTVAQIWAGLT
jgi:UPF0716 family protein affecting phage T7 exclusion